MLFDRIDQTPRHRIAPPICIQYGRSNAETPNSASAFRDTFKDEFGKFFCPNMEYDVVNCKDKSRSYVRLLTLGALWINKLKPKLNTKDEYRSRTLTLKF